MGGRGIDEVLMPGQVAALRRRIELLTPNHDRLIEELAKVMKDAPANTGDEASRAAADRATRQANRLKSELATIAREIETLQSLVSARLAQSGRTF
jgi:ubiquinone biosynthesis protein UbiJ